jgi:hypothetical protein
MNIFPNYILIKVFNIKFGKANSAFSISNPNFYEANENLFLI